MIEQNPALLRAPPFPNGEPVVSVARVGEAPRLDPDAIARLFTAIRDARVGGRFWAPSAAGAHHSVIIRPRSAEDVVSLLARLSHTECAVALWVMPAGAKNHMVAERLLRSGNAIFGDFDPWSLLNAKVRLVAHGEDEWVAIAHIAGCPVDILSPGRFGAVGADAQTRDRVAAELSRFCYRDPFTEKSADIASTIEQLGDWRRTLQANRMIVAACGIAWWKRREIAACLWTPEHPLRFFRSERRAIRYAARQRGSVAIWPSRISDRMPPAALEKSVPLIRIEDGFVRSIGLGSNLVPPSSIAVDRQGIHYDPSGPSDLEMILSTAQFTPSLLSRAQRLRRTILDAGISKYGAEDDHAFPPRASDRRLILVAGQVEDDMSVRLGGNGVASNLEVLRRARALEPQAEIWFRPHPDVDAGHRKGAVPDSDALDHADRIVRGGGMARLLDLVDAVQVLTSLTGFEALLRGREVTCHGTPFYAGWGLTHDLAPVPNRRVRRISLDQLVASVLILYPRYLDPVSRLPCPPETLIRRMTDGTHHNRLGWVSGIRRLQGQLRGRRR